MPTQPPNRPPTQPPGQPSAAAPGESPDGPDGPGGKDPLQRLRHDRARAAELHDPCANLCTVATVDAAGHPQARTLVLRDLDEGFGLFANETSPKWRQMQLGASLAVVVWLPSLNVQYRLQCDAQPLAKTTVNASWHLRPPVPKRLDWLYTRGHTQSSAIASREMLLRHLDELELPEPLTAPRSAGGVLLDPYSVERLDLARPDGVHDRRLYQRGNPGWKETLLVP